MFRRLSAVRGKRFQQDRNDFRDELAMLLADIGRYSARVQAVYCDTFPRKSLRQCSSEQYIGQFGATVGFERLIAPLKLNVVKSHAFYKTVCT